MKKNFASIVTQFSDIDLIGDWYWPGKDRHCWPWLNDEHDLPIKLSRFCKSKRTVIEAGGNAGFYVKAYAKIFDNVITFEPDTLNFRCLAMNTPEENIIRIQACLGDNNDFVSLHTTKKNIGSYHIDVSKNAKSLKNIPTLKIDNLNSQDCDLIHLDIEGWEFPALRGAIETIKRCKPVIAIEQMGHGDKFGYYEEDIKKFLKDLGYDPVEKIYNDQVFVHNIS